MVWLLAQNLALAQYLSGLPQDEARIHDVLAGLGIGGKAAARPHALSLGEAQRVALARAVINRPEVLFADEPTSNLDDDSCTRVLDLLSAQAEACGATLVVATHDRRAKERFAHRYELGPRR